MFNLFSTNLTKWSNTLKQFVGCFIQILFTLLKVYIYDIRSSSYLHQLKAFKDVVTALTYHPQVPKVS